MRHDTTIPGPVLASEREGTDNPIDSFAGSGSLAAVHTSLSVPNDSLSIRRKYSIVFVTSWTTLAACFSSTSLLSANKEIAADLRGTSEAVSLSTAGLLIAVGMSSLVWSPVASIVGRRVAYNICILFLLGFTIGAALAPSMPIFVTMRVLSGLQGSFFHVAGRTLIAEHFPPVQRGTATGFFLAGTVLGPPLGPLIAGIMMTYSSWRGVLWLQVTMIGLALVLAFFVVPPAKLEASGTFKLYKKWSEVPEQFNPLPVFRQMRHCRIFFTHLSCGFLSWSQYSVLSSPKHVLSESFGLKSPLSIGLFYIAPAAGFLVGTIFGGWHSDVTVRRYIKVRGERIPEDRLRSGMWSFLGIIPISSLIYGWGLQYCNRCTATQIGLALPIVTTFFTSAGLLAAFASLNTYCGEAIPKHRREVVTGKYLVQYTFSAGACAGVVPLMATIGNGWTATIGAIFAVSAGCLTLTVARFWTVEHKTADTC